MLPESESRPWSIPWVTDTPVPGITLTIAPESERGVGGGRGWNAINQTKLFTKCPPPPSVMVINPGIFGDHQRWLCPLVKLSRYGAQVYLFLPAEIICIHSQYFKQFSCQIMFADPGKFSISRQQISQNTNDGRDERMNTVRDKFFDTSLSIRNCWVHHNLNYSPIVPRARPPAGFWIFHLNKHSAPWPSWSPEILLWWQCRQYRLVSPGDSLFTETQGVWRQYES